MRSEKDNLVKDVIVGFRSSGQPRRRWVQDVKDWLKMTINDAAKLTGERIIWRKDVYRAAYLSITDGT